MKGLLGYGRRGLPLPLPGVTDIHGHLGRYAFAIPDLRPASLVRSMDRLGITRTVCSHMRCMSGRCSQGNLEVLAAMRRFPGRILGYMSIWPSSPRKVAQEIQWAAANGFAGIKLHNSTGFSYTYSAYAPAYAMADKQHWPALLHTWGEEKVLEEIRILARRYIGVFFILAHAGCSNIDGYIELACDCENVFLETSLSRSPRGLIEQLTQKVGPERIVWGSDAIFLCQAQQLGRILGARISERAKQCILAENASRILSSALRRVG